jgi:predicted O-linked N-acetylglucosamine transferase (SPINDLY family)
MSEQQQTLSLQQAIDLAVQHHNAGRLPEAENTYQQILQSEPNHPTALHLLGVIAHQTGKNDKAVDLITKALGLKPDYVEAHNNLSVVLHALGKLDDAISSTHKALAIMPNHLGALSNLGTILHEIGKFDDALKIFESIDTPVCSARVLECLFALGDYDKFYEMQHASVEKYKTNIRAAAISAFASQQLKREDPHLFCKEPMNFIRVYNSLDVFEDSETFRHDLIDELRNKTTVWEPLGKTTKQGFQTLTSINLFDNPSGRLAEVNQIVKDTIEKYRLEFSSEDCGFIKWFPNKLTFKAWFVRLLEKGHQTEHIHHAGWLSGVFYLQVPKFSDQEEGCIELGLWGYDYPVLNKNYPRKRYYPKNGDIILFPSSLFHRTIPFHSNEERMSIAFDLIPT